MPDSQKEREALLAVYPGKKWADKVKAMTNDQIVAIYLRLKSQGKVN